RCFSLACLLICMVPSSNVCAQSANREDKREHLLFFVQRNVDSKRVHYVLNRNSDGTLNADEPMSIFWVDGDHHARTSKLNIIQRRFVYGVRVQSKSEHQIVFCIAAYPNLSFYLRERNGQFRVYAEIEGEECVLKRIHVELIDENVINPKVRFVRLEGLSSKGQMLRQVIKK